MDWNFSQISDLFKDNKAHLLLDGKWGIERESQRVTPSGNLALTPHPAAFGSKLENTQVTTDFSESQIELITPPFDSIEETYEYLKELQSRVEKELKYELLWPMSMPPKLPREDDIPISKFDDTPLGREKEIYRSGLAERYGKKMQMISGIHYNFSFGERMLEFLYENFKDGRDMRTFKDDLYFAMARNFLRYRWLLIYLFGSSPTVDPTYYSVIKKELKIVSKCCPECCNPLDSYEKYTTSLRVSRFGYSDSVQGKDSVSFNGLSEYIKSIRELLGKKSSKFARLGLYKKDKQIQLNDNVLQKESEFYSSLRLKQNVQNGETQLDALEKKGVKYSEVRIIDLDPFEKTGISINQLYFLQVFMLFCLFIDGSLIGKKEFDKINKNHHLVALSGRKENLEIYRYDGAPEHMKSWGEELFRKLTIIASIMDKAGRDSRYLDSINREHEKIINPALLPSSKIKKEMRERNESYLQFGIRKALEHRKSNDSINYICCPVWISEIFNENINIGG